MRRSIATVSMSGTLRQKLEAIAAAHGCAEPFADRFFFEVVQRKAYDGYGAVNAPARMAAPEQNAESTRK